MKKIISVLAGVLIFSCLCACSAEKGETVVVTEAPTATAEATPSAEPTVEPTVTPTETPVEEIDLAAESAALNDILDQIDVESRPGSAGCSLSAVSTAADLLNWAKETKLSDEQVQSLTLQWLEDKGYGQQSDFNMKLDLTYNTYLSLIAPDSQDLMDEAGVDYAEGTWGYEPVSAIEAIETAVGPSDMIR